MPELPRGDDRLPAAAADLLRIVHAMPRQLPSRPETDLTIGQVRLLFLIRREGPLPMGRVADVFDLSSASATGLVARVERRGLVRRRHREDDRRIVECVLTDEGRRFVDELSGLRLEAIRGALATLSGRDLDRFGAIVRRIRERQEEQR